MESLRKRLMVEEPKEHNYISPFPFLFFFFFFFLGFVPQAAMALTINPRG